MIENTYFLSEALPKDEYVIATYRLELTEPMNGLVEAADIAIDQTTGTWVPVPGETAEVRAGHTGRVVGYYRVDDHQVVIRVAFPHVNFGPNLPLLLSTVLGNLSSRGCVKLLDLEFPPSLLAGFRGPRFGIDGIREILGVARRPLLCSVIKPCTGITPEVSAQLAFEAALGGVDLIKDDELIGDRPFSPMVERIKRCMERLVQADEIKGEKTLYAVNITDRSDRLIDNALRAQDVGANCLMVSYATVGWSALQALSEHPQLRVPILGHPNAAGVFYDSARSGMSAELACAKFPRFAGADSVLLYGWHGRFALHREEVQRIVHNLALPLNHLRGTLPMLGGNLHPGALPSILSQLGTDLILAAGGAVHGHPLGPRSGAIALRQAVEAVENGVPLSEAADEHKELRIALERWGVLPAESNW